MGPEESREQLRKLSQEILGESRRVLITGGTGFVGSQLAQVLHDAGHQITIMGRSRFRVRSDGNFFQGQISDSEDVDAACKDQEIVFHSAALTSPWGSLELHRSVNTQGTENVVNACKHNRVARLVHVSSTAIHFRFEDQTVEDDSPLPGKFSCAYAQSKAEAESIVQRAIADGLNAYIVRARAVFGPGDSALFPRLVAAARGGRLRQIGDGKNLCDLTYIDNLLTALILAAKPSAPTGLCTITNEDPIELWNLLHRVLGDLIPDYKSNSSIPRWLAIRLAHLAELKHRMLRQRGEPLLTRYTVGLLGYQQRFHSRAAWEELGYRPIVRMDDAIHSTIRSIKQRADLTENVPQVRMRLFSTGYIEVSRRLAERNATKEVTRIHATIALIEHPAHGPILFDLGYTPRFMSATQKWPFRLYRWTTKVVTHECWSPSAWVERCGYQPKDIRLILLSHFHGDHICGLKDFPKAEFITLDKTWDEAKDRKGFSALKRAILPDLIPGDFERRLHSIKDFNSNGLGPFERSHDLFRDGSLRLFELDGHAAGQMGVLVRHESGRHAFLIADAYWTSKEIEDDLEPTLAFRMVAENYRSALETRQKLQQLRKEHPEIELVCTHCPDIAAKERFDLQLSQAIDETKTS